jgi:hypothetical protein
MPQSVYDKIDNERYQLPSTRHLLFRKISKELSGRAVVTLFTSFRYPVQIDDDDCDMLQSVLQQTNLANGLILMINSPGGDILAAERMVSICRAYSGTKDYWALVPGRAKSAATIVCLGASKIIMASPSELGPIDPQILQEEDEERKWFSAFGLVNGYRRLFNEAVDTQGNVEPYIQQLARYDDREIRKYEGWIALSKGAAIKILSTGMMRGLTAAEIERNIAIFLEPEAGTQDHGRAINSSEARACELNVDDIDLSSPAWTAIYELYYRTDNYVSSRVSKVVESESEAFYESRPRAD